ncbi:MAG: thiamine diphosphokinase [Bacteroidota bacterium]|nr:thiamine diphosphokinase [Bacteroidota bacterium]
MMKVLLFLNGTAPGLNLLKGYLNEKAFIISADGASNYLKRFGVLPDLIIGDLDSISKSTFDYYIEKKVEIIKSADQDTTDFEKCLRYCIRKRLKHITVFGAISGRPDHTLNNFSVLERFYSRLNVKIISEEYETFFINKKISFRYKINETVSLLALPKAGGIVTSGLQYPLNNESLEFGVREGTLNKSTSKKVTVAFRSGSLLLFKKHFI